MSKGVSKQTIDLCIKGKRVAQNRLYHQYCDAMYHICLRIVNHREDAEDVLQKAFLDVFKKLKQFRYESSIGAWIKRIVINHAIDFVRKKKMVFEEMPAHISEVEEPYDDSETLYTVEHVKRAMKALPDGYRVVLSLYLFDGLDHQEIGEVLGISTNTSKSQYHRAKKKLCMLINQIT